MRVPLSWLADHVELPDDITVDRLDDAFVRMGFEIEEIDNLQTRVAGPLVVGRVLEIEELTGLKKPIRYCQVAIGTAGDSADVRGIICGAQNFAVDDLVVVALPGAVLPGDFTISARKTYGHISNGMICSERELGLGDDHNGILVLPADTPVPPGGDARPVVGLDDVVFDVNINPDRGYAFAIRGLARDVALALGVPFHDPGVGEVPAVTPEPPYPVTVADTEGCDRFATLVVRGVDPTAESPQWMKRRLTLAGMRSISLAVDITNYLMLELGQPMHAFDVGRLAGPLVVRRAAAGERMVTLDGVDRSLDPADMVICDDSGVVSLAAVMGGASTEVNIATTDVLFEAAHWDEVTVARTSRRHKLPSEAAKRWERGVDPAMAPVALARAVALLTEYAGGVADDRFGDIDHTAPREAIVIDADLPARVVGVDYSRDDVAAALTSLGCGVDADGARLAVTPPGWRHDLTDSYDLVEEVARLHGYDAVPPALPIAPAGSGLTASQRRRRSVARTLADAGYVEVLSYPFVSPEVHDAFGLPADDERRRALRLRNPLRDEEPELRTSLLPPLLTALRRNLSRGHRDVALYEVGTVFRPQAGSLPVPPPLPVNHRPGDEELAAASATVPPQPWRVAVVLTGDVEAAGWWGAGRAATWADAVEAGHLVAAAADVELTVRADEHAPWHPGRCAALLLPDGTIAGHAGELHPAVCDALELPRRTCAMELELDRLPLPAVTPMPRMSAYPPARIDVAVTVAAAAPAAEVQEALVSGAGELLESIRLFDVYTGDQIDADHKSLAYKLTFRAADRTLTAEEAVAARDAAVAEASRRVGATLRGN